MIIKRNNTITINRKSEDLNNNNKRERKTICSQTLFAKHTGNNDHDNDDNNDILC